MNIKSKILATILLLSLFSCQTEKEKLTIDAKDISIYVNNELLIEDWEVSKDEEINFIEIECSKEINEVSLVNTTDTFLFNISEKDTLSFHAISENKDTSLVNLYGVAPNITFSKKYIEENTGKVSVEINEVSELAMILVALHKDAEVDKNMTDFDTEYYQRVKKYFKPHLNHPIFDTINKHINGLRAVTETDTIFTNDSYLYYTCLKMNACAYRFNENNKIVNEGFIKIMAKDWFHFDPMKDVDLMTDFAQKSDFRNFYKQNEAYYDSLLVTYNKLNPISKMQDWLASKFKFTYGNYSIYFSPLTGGAHSAQKFSQGDFNQSFMFIARASYSDQYSETMNELMQARVLFTEIDHNYVNPISDKYLDEINATFAQRETWAQGEVTELYSTPYMIFNEYMTFAAYSLFATDNYSKEDVLEYLPTIEEEMKTKGFIQFKSFNRALLKKYNENKDTSIDELYKYMFEWSSQILD